MRHDTVIVGGSFAGLSAALYLGRARRSVAILDTRAPRNRFANSSHGFFAQDGSEPKAMLATMRAQVAAYPTVHFIDHAAVNAAREGDAFKISLASGEIVHGATLVLAFGITDILPDVPGVAERWGKSVLNCPYCHGYEVSGKKLGVLYQSPMSLHQASLIPEWGPTTLFLDGNAIDPRRVSGPGPAGVAIEPAPLECLVGEGMNLSAIRLRDGRNYPLDALFIGPQNRFNSDIGERLGCATETGPLGPTIVVDEMKSTSVAGVYAAGDITRAGHTVVFACADGAMAALAIHRTLVFGAKA